MYKFQIKNKYCPSPYCGRTLFFYVPFSFLDEELNQNSKGKLSQFAPSQRKN